MDTFTPPSIIPNEIYWLKWVGMRSCIKLIIAYFLHKGRFAHVWDIYIAVYYKICGLICSNLIGPECRRHLVIFAPFLVKELSSPQGKFNNWFSFIWLLSAGWWREISGSLLTYSSRRHLNGTGKHLALNINSLAYSHWSCIRHDIKFMPTQMIAPPLEIRRRRQYYLVLARKIRSKVNILSRGCE